MSARARRRRDKRAEAVALWREPLERYRQSREVLRYRMQEGRVTFYYDLIRPDLVHQAAALALVAKIKAGIGATPLLMGGCN